MRSQRRGDNVTEESYGRPIPPSGAQGVDAAQTAPASAPAPKVEKPKKKQGGGAKSFLLGILGGLVSAALVLCLANVGLFTQPTVTANNGNITIDPSEEDVTLAEAVAAKCIGSVATIYVYSGGSSNSPFGGSTSSSPSSLGSGVIISEDNGTYYIVTNSHVIDGASHVEVTIGDNNYAGQIVGQDEKSDLGVVSIQATGLIPMDWGDSADLSVGEWVMAIGSPYGYEQTVTTGIISAMYRSDVLQTETGGSSVYTDMIQTDAAINPGNSGGALVNAKGELIGINTYISSTSQSSAGLGFAIPSSTVQRVAEQIIAGQPVTHAFLGITMTSSTDPLGAAVTSVYRNTAAAQAGLQTGDVITKVDGKSVTTPSDVSIAVSSKSAGDTISITYVRNGQELTTTATLGSDDQDASEYADDGAPAQNNGSGSYGNSGNNNGGYGFNPFNPFGF